MGVGRQDAPDLAGSLDAARRCSFWSRPTRPPSTSRPPRSALVASGASREQTGFLPSLSLLSVFGVCLPFPIQDHGGSQEGHLPEGLESRPLA